MTAEATVNKPINLYQLGQEIGGNPPLRMVGPRPDGTSTVWADNVAQGALDAKVAAHVANPAVQPPPDPTVAQDAAESAFIAQRLPTVLGKARAIMADPTGAADFTTNERKVILAAVLLDLNQRRR